MFHSKVYPQNGSGWTSLRDESTLRGCSERPLGSWQGDPGSGTAARHFYVSIAPGLHHRLFSSIRNSFKFSRADPGRKEKEEKKMGDHSSLSELPFIFIIASIANATYECETRRRQRIVITSLIFIEVFALILNEASDGEKGSDVLPYIQPVITRSADKAQRVG